MFGPVLIADHLFEGGSLTAMDRDLTKEVKSLLSGHAGLEEEERRSRWVLPVGVSAQLVWVNILRLLIRPMVSDCSQAHLAPIYRPAARATRRPPSGPAAIARTVPPLRLRAMRRIFASDKDGGEHQARNLLYLKNCVVQMRHHRACSAAVPWGGSRKSEVRTFAREARELNRRGGVRTDNVVMCCERCSWGTTTRPCRRRTAWRTMTT